MGIDYGKKRVGIALSDETERFAYPHSVLDARKDLVGNTVKICRNERVGKIILGRSLDYKMRPNEIMGAISEFKNELEIASGLTIEFEDEFMTTQEAGRLQGENKMSDASAAALILKSYIDKHQS